jgi:hypothetical protein
VTSPALLLKIFNRLKRLRFIIALGGILVSVLLYLYAKQIPAVYSVKSTVFPLTAGPDKNSSSKLSELIGGGSGGTKSLSDEANVNIEEVAKSRKTREAVAGEKIQSCENKTVAELLIEEYNLRKSFRTPVIKKPNAESELRSTGSSLLKDAYTAKVNKNGLLEIIYTSTNEKLISPVSYILINKISQFYIELKIKKAQFDFDFTTKKVDSLDGELAKSDKNLITLNNTTLFVRPNKLQYTIPQENLENSKLQVLAQRNGAASNREEALWRMQKATPIISIMDTPEPPFDIVKPSNILYGLVGFIVGCILFSLLFVAGLLFKFANHQVKETIAEKLAEPKSNITTPNH